MAAFLVGTVLFFAWIAVTIFKDLDHGNKGFESFKDSLNSMFIAGASKLRAASGARCFGPKRWLFEEDFG